jgi:hypothetical protein
MCFAVIAYISVSGIKKYKDKIGIAKIKSTS